MNSIFQMMGKIARVDGTVLITGESGTGKELVARAIHFAEPAPGRPVRRGQLRGHPADLIESEFFGHSKGAFTDAKTEKTGKFELAQGGTIFLDEIGELSLEAQVKLLRALGEREIVKVGGTETIPVDVRVIAATNKDLEEAVRRGIPRGPLFSAGRAVAPAAAAARAAGGHPAPVRALREEIQPGARQERQGHLPPRAGAVRHLSLAGKHPGAGERSLRDIGHERRGAHRRGAPACQNSDSKPAEDFSGPLDKPLGEIVAGLTERAEKSVIEKALEATGWNKTRAAGLLGISRKTLFNKMTSLGIRGRD